MIHDPSNNRLTVAAPSYTTFARLLCGCKFVLRVAGAGDTSIIKYRIPSPDSATSHDVKVTASITGVPSGTYTSWLALWSYDWEKGALRDTIVDTLVIP